jgi:type I restriction enzyme R subunit
MRIFESHIEQLVIELLEDQGFGYLSPEQLEPIRPNLSEVILLDRLISAVNRLNPTLPASAHQEAIKTVCSVYSPQLIDTNETFHRYLTEGVPVSIRKDGHDRGEKVWLIDFQNPENNDFLAVNQYTVYRT